MLARPDRSPLVAQPILPALLTQSAIHFVFRMACPGHVYQEATLDKYIHNRIEVV